jgi:antitoxin component YwqK of YwqJK toxin-antitoxin module
MNSNDPTTKPPSPVKPLKHIIDYHPNSNIKSREYNLNENNQFHGLYERWHPNGRLWIRLIYQNGRRHGLYEKWNPNGSIRCRFFYNNGKIE